ncbi:MAG: hypothetical protein GOVbin1096_17 [Prokaryotic dsDNA virus sp.]|jgi:hypothetical protein|nr:MAG: hypothetical protein GOVbin1096_17 [Prokaryotic dsDNA virus sp.]|tara:strand:- start:46645 stop:46992 length:348 start_codon:yes stop_codon:yes gene_type:complete
MANDPTMEEILAAMQEFTGQASAGGGSLEQYREILPILFKEGDIATEMLDEVVEKFGPKLGEYLDKIREFMVKGQVNTYKQLTEGGISPDNAIRLMIHQQDVLNQAFKNIEISRK